MSDYKHKRIVFMGTSSFSLKALSAICDANFNVVGVYSRAPKPRGRNYKFHKSVVHEFAESRGIPIFTPKTIRTSEQEEIFRALQPDLAVVASYGLIIPQNILDIAHHGFINIHASILPRWRGAAPIRAAILAGDKQTGISIMKMDAGIDTGDIISIKSIDIFQKTNHEMLEQQMADLGATMIVDTLYNLDTSLTKAQAQPENGAIYAPKTSKDDSRIDWNESAENILRKIMAYAPSPAAWSEIDDLRIKISDADIVEAEDNSNKNHDSVAKLTEDANKSPLVACGCGYLKLITLQPAGKNTMSGSDFIRGRRNLLGKSFR